MPAHLPPTHPQWSLLSVGRSVTHSLALTVFVCRQAVIVGRSRSVNHERTDDRRQIDVKRRTPDVRRQTDALVDWSTTAQTGQTGWLVGWLVGWLAGWLAGWLVGWLVSSFVCGQPAALVMRCCLLPPFCCCFVNPSTHRPVLRHVLSSSFCAVSYGSLVCRVHRDRGDYRRG